MALNGTEQNKKHRVEMTDRTSAYVTGVSDVINFDESSVVLDTCVGILSIDGQDLHIVNLNVDSGEISVSGSSINGIIYPQSFSKGSGGFFRKRVK